MQLTLRAYKQINYKLIYFKLRSVSLKQNNCQDRQNWTVINSCHIHDDLQNVARNFEIDVLVHPPTFSRSNFI